MESPDYVSYHGRQCDMCLRVAPHEVREYVDRGIEETICKSCGHVTKLSM